MSSASTCLGRPEATERTVALLHALLDIFASCRHDLGLSLAEKGSHRLEPQVVLAPLGSHSCTLAVAAAAVVVAARIVVVVEGLGILEELAEGGQSNHQQMMGLNLLVQPSPVPKQQQIALKGQFGEIDALKALPVAKQDSL